MDIIKLTGDVGVDFSSVSNGETFRLSGGNVPEEWRDQPCIKTNLDGQYVRLKDGLVGTWGPRQQVVMIIGTFQWKDFE